MIKFHKRLILSFLIVFISCNEKKTVQNKKIKPPEKKVIKSIPKKEEKIFILNDKNAIPFFFEYEKNNKENKIRIETKYGDIDIELFNQQLISLVKGQVIEVPR